MNPEYRLERIEDFLFWIFMSTITILFLVIQIYYFHILDRNLELGFGILAVLLLIGWTLTEKGILKGGNK